jgi:hypothetical protein
MRIASIVWKRDGDQPSFVVTMEWTGGRSTAELSAAELASYALSQRSILEQTGLLYVDSIADGRTVEQADERWKLFVSTLLMQSAQVATKQALTVN